MNKLLLVIVLIPFCFSCQKDKPFPEDDLNEHKNTGLVIFTDDFYYDTYETIDITIQNNDVEGVIANKCDNHPVLFNRVLKKEFGQWVDAGHGQICYYAGPSGYLRPIPVGTSVETEGRFNEPGEYKYEYLFLINLQDSLLVESNSFVVQ